MGQESDVALVMDWGGTWSRMAVVNRSGELLWQSRVRNALGAGPEQLLGDTEGLIRQALDWCGPAGQERTVAGLGIAVAGPVDANTGTLRQPPNLPALDGVSLKARWETGLGLPVYVGNDADLAALGEYQYGAGLAARQQGQAVSALVYVTVSTGIGGGVIDRGHLLLGTRGMAAEVGHMTIDRSPGAPACACGGAGCLESLASGTSIARAARRRVTAAGPGSSLLAGPGIEQLAAEQVFSAAERGDPLALSVVDDAVEALGVGLTNILHLYNPDLLVMGGGVTFGLVRLGLLPRIQARMAQRAMSAAHTEFRLVPSGLGDAPGMLGAACLVWQAN